MSDRRCGECLKIDRGIWFQIKSEIYCEHTSPKISQLSASLEAARKKNLGLEIKLRELEAEKKKNREMEEDAKFWKPKIIETSKRCGELLDRLKTSEEALEGLLDGLDENNDDRCGLSMEEWQKRVKQARDALKPEK